MPELPEVETMRRGLLPIVGATITRVARTRCRKKPISIQPSLSTFNRRVTGRSIAGIDRLGKRVIIVLDDGQRMVIEPRMTGLVSLGEPPSQEHLRFECCLEETSPGRFWFWDRRGLGLVRLHSPGDFEATYGERRLGQDALECTPRELISQFGHLTSPVKVALLNQQRIAGIGNLYASEILHLAGIHPAVPCRNLQPQQWQAIHRAIGKILRAAIRSEGSTLSDGTYRTALNEPGGYQSQHQVYDRAGERCLRCRRAEVVRIVQAQRSTFYCPNCQPPNALQAKSSRRRRVAASPR